MDSIISLDTAINLSRIAFGALFLFKLISSIRARQLVWAHRTPFAHLGRGPLNILLALLVGSVICFTLGLFSGLNALLMCGLYIFLYRYASLFGLEDVSFQHLSFYFIFAGTGSTLALDSLLETHLWGRIPADSLIPELSLTTAIGILFFSAGLEKLPSPMWRKGLGCYYFFLLPQFRRLDTSPLTSQKELIIALNWLALGMELFFFPVLFLGSPLLNALFWLMAFGFTISLFTVFILTWIGETMSLSMLLIAWLLIHSDNAGLHHIWGEQLALIHNNPLSLITTIIILLTLSANLITTVIPTTSSLLKDYPIIQLLYKYSRYISRFTWGLIPIEVFTEAHMEGPLVYRTFATLKSGERREVFKIFDDSRRPGPARPFRPAFFEVTSYKVTESCMEVDAVGSVAHQERNDFLLQLSQHILNCELEKLDKRDVAELCFHISQITPPQGFKDPATFEIATPWIQALRVSVRDGIAQEVQTVERKGKLVEYPTGRSLDRLSFAFNPAAK